MLITEQSASQMLHSAYVLREEHYSEILLSIKTGQLKIIGRYILDFILYKKCIRIKMQ